MGLHRKTDGGMIDEMKGFRKFGPARHWALAIALAACLAMAAPDAEPVLAAAAEAGETRYLVPGGKNVGIAIETEGLVVVGTSDLGRNASPARLAGLSSGDIITEVDGRQVRTASDLAQALKSGQTASVTIVRDDQQRTLQLTPAVDPRDGSARIGAWVRSSTAGVGTLSFVDPETGGFAALGHAISDIDTGVTLPVEDGGLYESRIVEIRPSERGTPGEIIGDFLSDEEQIGEITRNSDYGVFGASYSGDLDELPYPQGLPVAAREEVKKGSAQILTTLDDEVRAFDCEIEHIEKDDRVTIRSMVVHITDPELIARTGGIVQGMSGSPIIQDGKLVGAVTHVLVNDPTRGYGIFIENMLDAA